MFCKHSLLTLYLFKISPRVDRITSKQLPTGDIIYSNCNNSSHVKLYANIILLDLVAYHVPLAILQVLFNCFINRVSEFT